MFTEEKNGEFKPTVPLPGDYIIISRGARTSNGSIAIYRLSIRLHLSASGDLACCLPFPIGGMSVKRARKFAEFLASLFNCKIASLPDNEFAQGMTADERKTSYELKAL